MIWVIIAILIAIIFGLHVGEGNPIGGFIAFILSGIFLVLFAVFFAFLIGISYSNPYSEPESLNQAIELKSFNDRFGTSGGYFVGFGLSSHYYFYKINPNGSYSLDKVPTYNSTIVEENRQNGALMIYVSKTIPKWTLFYRTTESACYRYEFHVPIGTVKTEFKADLQ